MIRREKVGILQAELPFPEIMFSETYFGERHVPKNTRRSYPTSKSRIWEKNEEKKLVLSSTPPNKNRLWSSSKNWWCWQTRSRLWEQIQIKFSEAYLDAQSCEQNPRPGNLPRKKQVFFWSRGDFRTHNFKRGVSCGKKSACRKSLLGLWERIAAKRALFYRFLSQKWRKIN